MSIIPGRAVAYALHQAAPADLLPLCITWEDGQEENGFYAPQPDGSRLWITELATKPYPEERGVQYAMVYRTVPQVMRLVISDQSRLRGSYADVAAHFAEYIEAIGHLVRQNQVITETVWTTTWNEITRYHSTAAAAIHTVDNNFDHLNNVASTATTNLKTVTGDIQQENAAQATQMHTAQDEFLQTQEQITAHESAQLTHVEATDAAAQTTAETARAHERGEAFYQLLNSSMTTLKEEVTELINAQAAAANERLSACETSVQSLEATLTLLLRQQEQILEAQRADQANRERDAKVQSQMLAMLTTLTNNAPTQPSTAVPLPAVPPACTTASNALARAVSFAATPAAHLTHLNPQPPREEILGTNSKAHSADTDTKLSSKASRKLSRANNCALHFSPLAEDETFSVLNPASWYLLILNGRDTCILENQLLSTLVPVPPSQSKKNYATYMAQRKQLSVMLRTFYLQVPMRDEEGKPTPQYHFFKEQVSLLGDLAAQQCNPSQTRTVMDAFDLMSDDVVKLLRYREELYGVPYVPIKKRSHGRGQ